MSIWCSHASPLSMSAKASTSVTLPARIDFTSDPASTRPASSVSSTWYSCRARLLRASTFTSSAGFAFATGRPGERRTIACACLDWAPGEAYDWAMSSRRDAGARRARGMLLAAVLVVSQASAWFHAVAISHVACLEHGEAIHGLVLPAEEAIAARAGDQTTARADLAGAAGHDHCANAALLRWRDVALTAPVALPGLAPAARSSAFAAATVVANAAAVYRLAPKTSPPARV